MDFKEGLDICKEALYKHEGGKEFFLKLIDILDEYFSDNEIEDDE